MAQKPFVLPSGVDFYAGDGSAVGSADPLLIVSDSTNRVGINTQSPTGTLDVTVASSGDRGVIIRTNTGQATNVFEVLGSNSSGIFSIDQSGGVYFAPWSGTAVNPIRYSGSNNRLIFTGSGTGASGINLNILQDSTISFEATAGQLFSISDGLSSGTIFSVNDISGMSSIEVDASGLIKLGEFDGFVGVGTSQRYGQYSGKVEINYPSGSYKGLIVRPSAGGTGNAFEVQSSASGTLVVIDASGEFGINNPTPAAMLDVVSRAATVKGVTVKGASSQSTSLIEWASQSLTLGAIDSAGKLGIGTSSPTGTVDITTVTGSTKGLILRANNAQSVNVFEIVTGAASPLVTVDSGGAVSGITATLGSGITLLNGIPSSTTSKIYASGTTLYWNGQVVATGNIGGLTGGVNSGIAIWNSATGITYDSTFLYSTGNKGIVFTGTGVGATPINLNVKSDSSLSFEGISGQIFKISDGLVSGDLLAVRDIAGVPRLQIDNSGLVKISEFDGFVGIGTSQTYGSYLSKVLITPQSAYKGLIIRPATYVTTGNMLEIQNAASTPVGFMDVLGNISGVMATVTSGITFTSGIKVGANAGSGRFNSSNNAIFIGHNAGILSSGGTAANATYQIFMGSGAGSFSSPTSLISNKTDIAIGLTAYQYGNSNGIIGLGASALVYGSGNTNAIAIGASALSSASGSSSTIAIGVSAGANSSGNSNSVLIGQTAGQYSTGSYNTYVGFQAGFSATGTANTFIGYGAGYNFLAGTGNIEILGTYTATSILAAGYSNKLNINSLLVGDVATKRLAIGLVSSGNLSPNATLEVIASGSTDKVLIVKGAASQSVNYLEVQNSSSTPLLAITSSGAISGAITPTILTSTGNLTLTDVHNGYIIEQTGTVASGTFTLGTINIPGWNCMIINIGSGVIVSSGSNTMRSPGGLNKSRTQYSSVSIYRRGSSDFVLGGDLA